MIKSHNKGGIPYLRCAPFFVIQERSSIFSRMTSYKCLMFYEIA